MFAHQQLRSLLVMTLSTCSLCLHLTSANANDASTEIKDLAKKVFPEIVELRRAIHRCPELANREVLTAKLVADNLRRCGVDDVATSVAHTGVIAIIKGYHSGRTIAIRSDLDALPLEELTGLPYSSEVKGVMHACGHDAHTAMLIGVAKVLVTMRARIHGQVKLIFQPAEEGVPAGEEGGAALMIKEHVLTAPDVDAIVGLHVNPDITSGLLGFRHGGIMASVDRFKVTINGVGTHAAMPWEGVDSVEASAEIISSLQSIVSRRIDARKAAVVSVSSIHGGQAWNIIPDSVTFEGTSRTHDPAVRNSVRKEFYSIVENIAAAKGATSSIEYNDLAPVLWNDATFVDSLLPGLRRALGDDKVIEATPLMAGEDFALYANVKPAAFFFLGVRNEKLGAIHPLHSPKFTMDEAAMQTGVEALSTIALSFLSPPK